MKYPKEADIEFLNKDNSYQLLDVNYPLAFIYFTKGYQYGVSVGIAENLQKLSAEEWFSQYYNGGKAEAEKNNEPFIVCQKKESVKFNDYDAYRVGVFGGDSTNYHYLISKGIYIYDIAYREEVIENVPDWPEKKTNIDKILSTFQFLENNSAKIILASKDIYFSDKIKGQISLETYYGDAQLSFKAADAIISELFLGSMTFTESRYQLMVKKLNPKNNQDFIVLQVVVTSNSDAASFYGYDFSKNKLIKYIFQQENNATTGVIYFQNIDFLSSKDFVTRFYDNGIGKIRVATWRFDDQNNIFKQINFNLETL